MRKVLVLALLTLALAFAAPAGVDARGGGHVGCTPKACVSASGAGGGSRGGGSGGGACVTTPGPADCHGGGRF